MSVSPFPVRSLRDAVLGIWYRLARRPGKCFPGGGGPRGNAQAALPYALEEFPACQTGARQILCEHFRQRDLEEGPASLIRYQHPLQIAP